MKANDLENAIVTLDDYLRGQGSDTETAAFEDVLFERALAGAATELSFVDDLVSVVRKLGEHGSIDLYMGRRGAERVLAANQHRKVQQVDVLHSSELQTYTLDRDTDLFLARFLVDLRGLEDIDVELYFDGATEPMKVLRDITIDPDHPEVYFCCEGDLARATVGVKTRSCVYGRDQKGRRLVAELVTLGLLGA